jgi:hypothetical protein
MGWRLFPRSVDEYSTRGVISTAYTLGTMVHQVTLTME